MNKKLKYGIAIIGILIAIVMVLFIKNKAVTENFNKSTAKSKAVMEGAQVSTDEGGLYKYNTAGTDSANYPEGDKTKKRTEWDKSGGDTWTYTFYVDDPNAQWHVWEDSNTIMEGYTGDYTEYNNGTLYEEENLTEAELELPEDVKITYKSNGDIAYYTWLDSENSYKVIKNDDGTYKKITTKLSFTVTNYNINSENNEVVSYGNLTIKKIVNNSEGEELKEDSTTFSFKVTLTATEENKTIISGTKIFGDIVFKDGVGNIALKAGESITISNIPTGVSYLVEENPVSGYEQVNNGNTTGTITKDSNDEVIFTNVKVATSGGTGGSGSGEANDPAYVDILLKKAVTGNYEVEEDYNFEITLNNVQANTTYSIEKNSNKTSIAQTEESFTSDSVGNANVAVSLKNGESIKIKDIPVGAKYKVYEYAGDYISSYSITDSNNLGKINNTANLNTKANKELATSYETADKDEEITITFTNKKIVTQNLRVAKEVTNNEDTNEYNFEVKFSNMNVNTSFNSSVGKITADENGEAEITINLADGDEAEFYDVPVGTMYQVTELASTAIASYTIVDENGGDKIESESGANGSNKTPLSTAAETVNEGEEVIVKFINDTINLSEEESAPDSVEVSLGVTKVVINKDDELIEDCNDAFTFELKANDDSYPMPDQTANKTITITGNGTESFGTITFTETGTYTYTITEKAGNSEDYTYDDTTYTIVYEVTNPEGLLEVAKTVRKNGFNGDVVTFTNKTDKYNGEETEEPTNPDKQSNTDDGSENTNNKEQTKENKDENNGVAEKIVTFITTGALPKTGDSVAMYVVLTVIAIAGVVFVIIKNNK